MRASLDLIDFIKRIEGFRENVYIPLKGDKPTVGYGFTEINGIPVKLGDSISPEAANVILIDKLLRLSINLVKKGMPTNLVQNKFDAALSLIYNIGLTKFCNSDTGRLFFEGKDICNKFPLWIYFKGEIIPGLIERRKKEACIYEFARYL